MHMHIMIKNQTNNHLTTFVNVEVYLLHTRVKYLIAIRARFLFNTSLKLKAVAFTMKFTSQVEIEKLVTWQKDIFNDHMISFLKWAYYQGKIFLLQNMILKNLINIKHTVFSLCTQSFLSLTYAKCFLLSR